MDLELWDVMDRAADDVAKVLAGNQMPEVLGKGRDGVGTTHHEAGTLRMGDDPNTSVTDPRGRFHQVSNVYVAGPALFPTIGSPNPMLTGLALARRTADFLVPKPSPAPPERGFEYLFDGTEDSFNPWQTAGRGTFSLIDGAIIAQPGGDLGLFYYPTLTFGDFILRLQFRLSRVDDNSGVFIRSRDPTRRVPDRNNPNVSYPYDNKAWVAVDTGFEVQIDELARGDPQRGIPDGLDEHRTGAIYGIPIGQGPGKQNYRRGPVLAPGVWHEYEIELKGNTYKVLLDGQVRTTFTNNDAYRGKPPDQDPHSGYIGLQAHTGEVAFRNVRIERL